MGRGAIAVLDLVCASGTAHHEHVAERHGRAGRRAVDSILGPIDPLAHLHAAGRAQFALRLTDPLRSIFRRPFFYGQRHRTDRLEDLGGSHLAPIDPMT